MQDPPCVEAYTYFILFSHASRVGLGLSLGQSIIWSRLNYLKNYWLDGSFVHIHVPPMMNLND